MDPFCCCVEDIFQQHSKEKSKEQYSENAALLITIVIKTNKVWAGGIWETRWGIRRCRLRECVHTPSCKSMGHNLARLSLMRLNRVGTGYDRLNVNTNQMGLSPSASCQCGAANQTEQHIASECPLHSCNDDLVVLDTAARNWLRDMQCVVGENAQ